MLQLAELREQLEESDARNLALRTRLDHTLQQATAAAKLVTEAERVSQQAVESNAQAALLNEELNIQRNQSALLNEELVIQRSAVLKLQRENAGLEAELTAQTAIRCRYVWVGGANEEVRRRERVLAACVVYVRV